MTDNNAGIIALGGFAFQILVFVAKLAEIEKNNIFNYEVDDDISSKNISERDEWNGTLKTDNEFNYYQVKKTNITESKAKKTLYNWLLTEKKGNYFLIVGKGYAIDDFFITTRNANAIYDDLDGSKSNKSLEKQVYLKYKVNNLFNEFLDKINDIRNHYYLEAEYDPREKIFRNYEKLMHKTSSDTTIYKRRLKKFCDQIQLDILEESGNNKAYSIDYDTFIRYIDEICTLTTNEEFISNYQAYKNKIELNNSIKNRREYLQLNECSLTEAQIITYLENELYYEDFKNYSIEHNNLIRIDNIEEEACQNFEESKDDEKNDTPKKLLKDTTGKLITNTNDKMQSTGTYISLTSEESKRISWSKLDD